MENSMHKCLFSVYMCTYTYFYGCFFLDRDKVEELIGHGEKLISYFGLLMCGDDDSEEVNVPSVFKYELWV